MDKDLRLFALIVAEGQGLCCAPAYQLDVVVLDAVSLNFDITLSEAFDAADSVVDQVIEIVRVDELVIHLLRSEGHNQVRSLQEAHLDYSLQLNYQIFFFEQDIMGAFLSLKQKRLHSLIEVVLEEL